MMKLKFFIPAAIWVVLIALTACSEMPASDAITTDLRDITIIPYTSEELGISGLVPEGWIEVKPGLFLRMPNNDPTLLGQVAFPDATMDQVTSTMQLPESVGSMETINLTWDMYHGELEWPDAGTFVYDVALSESASGTYLVTLVTLSDEFELLHDEVMVPVIQALVPANVTETPSVEKPATPPSSKLKPIDTRIRPADRMTMVYVPAGEFEMGNPGIQWMWSGSLFDNDLNLQVFIDESPQHIVYLDAYWIDQTEVSVAMFRTFVEATGYETTAERDGWGAPYKARPEEEEWPHVPGTTWQHPQSPDSSASEDHPVVQVSWEDATAYCEWAGGKLPTEAQWEKAARGTDDRLWPWGTSYDGNRGSFCDAQCPVERWKQETYDDGYALTAPVGNFPSGASPYGALDMAGNVWEWVADWYGENYYAYSPSENPTGPSYATERTQRGGAWYDNGSWVRTTVRHSTPPQTRADDLGFRCAFPVE